MIEKHPRGKAFRKVLCPIRCVNKTQIRRFLCQIWEIILHLLQYYKMKAQQRINVYHVREAPAVRLSFNLPDIHN